MVSVIVVLRTRSLKILVTIHPPTMTRRREKANPPWWGKEEEGGLHKSGGRGTQEGEGHPRG